MPSHRARFVQRAGENLRLVHERNGAAAQTRIFEHVSTGRINRADARVEQIICRPSDQGWSVGAAWQHGRRQPRAVIIANVLPAVGMTAGIDDFLQCPEIPAFVLARRPGAIDLTAPFFITDDLFQAAIGMFDIKPQQ